MRFDEHYYKEGFKDGIKGFVSKLKGSWNKVKKPILNAFERTLEIVKFKFVKVIQKSFGLGLKVIGQLVNIANIEPDQKKEIQNALNQKDLVHAIKEMANLNKKYKSSPEEIKMAKDIGLKISQTTLSNVKKEGYDYDCLLTEGFLDSVKKSMSNPNVLRNAILLILLFAMFFPVFAEGFTQVINGVEHIVKGLEFSTNAAPVGQATDVAMRYFDEMTKGETILNSNVINSVHDFFKVTVGTYLKTGTNEVLSNTLNMVIDTKEGMKTLFQYFPVDATGQDIANSIKEMLKSDPDKAQEIIDKLKLYGELGRI